jgi:broad specificity polyphosphatase/5'/3'-nucleotidase SurE
VAYYREPKAHEKHMIVDGMPLPNENDLADSTTDVGTFRTNRMVSVTPLSLDMTSRVNLTDLQDLFGKLD